tara:strand:- start:28 stop:405 length:378 start_codon:yes stop_codon:yes gene_type:complete
MVLYYKSIENKIAPDCSPRVEISTPTQCGTRPSLIHHIDHSDHIDHIDHSDPIKQHFYNEVYKSPFSDRLELYHALLEDNYNNLSTDDKLVIMYKAMIIRNNKTNNYILLCLCVLVIIALKLFSK